MGRSRGGYSSKIHTTVETAGKPLRYCLSPGQGHDIKQAERLIEGFAFERVIADRGYAAQAFVDKLLAKGVEVVIPPHPRAKAQRAYDKRWYRERNLVERYFNKIKHLRVSFLDLRNWIHLILVFCILSVRLSGYDKMST